MTTSSIMRAPFPRRTEVPVPPGPARGVAERSPLRMRLRRGDPGVLDRARWPQTRNLQVEMADLVDHFPAGVGRIDRAVFSPPDWLPSPRRIKIARGFLKVGSFPRDDTHVVLLRLSTGETLKLLVVPTATSASQAARMMQAATSVGTRLTAQAILDLPHASGGSAGEVSADHWNDDCGASARTEPRISRPPAE